MKIAACCAALLGALVVGCASNGGSTEGGLYTNVSSLDYAKRVCGYVEIDQFATCVNGMLLVYEEPPKDGFPPEQATSGPFMVTLGPDRYYGWYRSHPFAADFRVSNGKVVCRGSYSAFAGSSDAVFDVRCDDGRQGTAETVRDAKGRNGIGTITMADGTVGHIVFGRDVLRGTPAEG